MNIQHNSINFINQHFYIGIDVHKNRWSVTIRNNNLILKTFSMNPSPDQLNKYLQSNYPQAVYHIVYEIGFSGFWIYRRFKELNLDCIVVNPADIPTAHKEIDRKSDPIDSNKLARELEKGDLKPIYIPDQQIQHLRSLTRLYHTIIQNITRVKNRIKGHLYYNGITLPPHTSHWSNNFISYLLSLELDNGPSKDYLLLLLEELQQHRNRLLVTLKKLRYYASISNSNKTIHNLLTIPGIGFKSAITLFTEIMDMNRFKSLDQLKSYIGLVPSTYSSGEHNIVKGITKRRNSYLRYVIIESAWVAIRKDPVLLSTYNALILRMKKQQAIIRIARKLLSRIRYVWINNHAYVQGVVQ